MKAENPVKMSFLGKVRDRVRSFFNPDAFDAGSFRSTAQMALMGMVIAELTVYVLLRQSSRLGELPPYITDVIIMTISTLEFFLAPLIGWLGSRRRRTTLVMWVVIALVCMLPVFGTPSTVTETDTALCTMQYRFLPEVISPRAAVRLSILVLAGLACALGRVAVTAHALAYLDEAAPSTNTHMNLGIFLIVRVVPMHVGYQLMGSLTERMPWVQALAILVKFTLVLIKLHTFPVMPPAAAELGTDRSDQSLLASLTRVFRCKLAMFLILAMSLLASAVWGFGSQEANFAKAKFHIVAGEGMNWDTSGSIRALFIITTVILSGYIYTAPAMPIYKKKKALLNAARMSIYSVILFVMITAFVSCFKGSLAGMGESTYNQPPCGLRCSCDRPWTSFAPVCDPQDMTTYFSPCHAGCATSETAGEVGFYANCTCTAGGLATVGSCGDGSCNAAYALHSLLFTCLALACVLGLTWQGSVMLESVDRRDKSVAIGLACAMVSLFAFIGGHGIFMWISDSTCASFRGRKCLWHNSEYVPLVGYTCAVLAGGSLLICITAAIVLQCRKKKEKQEIEEVDLARD